MTSKAGAPGDRTLLGNVLTYLVLTAAALWAVLPIAWGLSTSLKPESQVVTFPPRWFPSAVTLENYFEVLFRSNFPTYFINSLLVTSAAVVLTLVVAAHAGYAAARFRFRFRNSLLFLILMTAMIPGISVLVPLYLLSVRAGLYDTHWSMILIYAAWQTPTVVWILKGFFETVPRDLEEAAAIDGCGPWRAFYQIILPISQPGLAAAALLAAVYVWNDFLIAFTFTTRDELRLLSVGLYLYISQYGIQWGELMAAVIVALLPIVVLFVALQSRFIHGLSAGATKG